MFAEDAAVASHTQQELQSLMDRFSKPARIISLKMTNVLRKSLQQTWPLTTSLTRDWKGSNNTRSPHHNVTEELQSLSKPKMAV